MKSSPYALGHLSRNVRKGYIITGLPWRAIALFLCMIGVVIALTGCALNGADQNRRNWQKAKDFSALVKARADKGEAVPSSLADAHDFFVGEALKLAIELENGALDAPESEAEDGPKEP